MLMMNFDFIRFLSKQSDLSFRLFNQVINLNTFPHCNEIGFTTELMMSSR